MAVSAGVRSAGAAARGGARRRTAQRAGVGAAAAPRNAACAASSSAPAGCDAGAGAGAGAEQPVAASIGRRGSLSASASLAALSLTAGPAAVRAAGEDFNLPVGKQWEKVSLPIEDGGTRPSSFTPPSPRPERARTWPESPRN